VKHQLVIPNNIVEKAKLHPGDDLMVEVDRKRRIVMSLQPPQPKPMKFNYDQFRIAIFNVLVSCPQGLTYTEIRAKAPGLPIKPNAIWVNRLIGDVGLKRERGDDEGRRLLWKMETRKPSE